MSTAGTRRPLLVRVAAAAAAALGLVLLGAAPALAHASLVGETPAAGSTVRKAPGTVVFRFDENIRQPSKVIVTGPDGTRVDHGATSVLDNTASVALTMTQRGRYTMSYRVISADGHPVTSQTRFDYQGPVSAAPAAGAPDKAGSPGSSTAGLKPGSARWVVVGVLVVLGAVGALLLAGRRRQPPASDTGEDPGTAADQPRSPL